MHLRERSPSGPSTLEILGRCNVCVQNKKSIAYCRQNKCHKVPKATPCVECYNSGIPTVTCRLDLSYLSCRVCITETRVNTEREGERPDGVCKPNELLQCCTELASLTLYTPPKPDTAWHSRLCTCYLLDLVILGFLSGWEHLSLKLKLNTAFRRVPTRAMG